MGTQYANGKIVTDGLVLSLDASDQNSYPGSGTTWNDLAGSNNGTLINGPTFDSNGNASSIVFDGVDDYVVAYNAINTGLGFSGTVEVITSVTGSTIMNERENNGYGNGYFVINEDYTFRVGVNSKAGFPYTYFLTSSLSGNIGGINHYIASYEIPPGQGTSTMSGILGINGNFESVTGPIITDRSNSGFDNIEIGRHRNYSYGTSYCFPGNIYLVRIYNKRLSQEEMLQNYNAQKSRFGL